MWFVIRSRQLDELSVLGSHFANEWCHKRWHSPIFIRWLCAQLTNASACEKSNVVGLGRSCAHWKVWPASISAHCCTVKAAKAASPVNRSRSRTFEPYTMPFAAAAAFSVCAVSARAERRFKSGEAANAAAAVPRINDCRFMVLLIGVASGGRDDCVRFVTCLCGD